MIRYPNKRSWGCGKGWYDLIEVFITKMSVLCEEEDDVEIIQIKEKFGGLRIYCQGGTPEVFDLIQRTENKSYEICEVCGNDGTYHNELTWKSTLCPKHFREYLAKDRKDWEFWEWKNHIIKTIKLFFRKQYAKLKRK